jgi:hypothetical protein
MLMLTHLTMGEQQNLPRTRITVAAVVGDDLIWTNDAWAWWRMSSDVQSGELAR